MAEDAPPPATTAPAPPPKRRPWKRRLFAALSTLATIAGGVVLFVFLAAVGFVLWLRTPAGNRFLTMQAVLHTRAAMEEGSLDIGSIDTDLFGRTTVTAVKLTDGQGRVLLGADRIALSYDLVPLWGQRLQVDEAEVDGLVVDLSMGDDGVLDLLRVFGQTEPTPPSSEPWSGLPVAFDVDELKLRHADVHYSDAPGTDVHVRIDIAGSNKATGLDRYIGAPDVTIVGAVLAPVPEPLPFTAHGGVSYTGDGVDLSELIVVFPGARASVNGTVVGLEGDGPVLDLDVGVQRLDLRLAGMLAHQPPLHGALASTGADGNAGVVTVQGPLTAIAVKGTLSGAQELPGVTPGSVTVDAVIDAPHDVAWTGSVALKDVAVESLYEVPDTHVAVNGTFTGKGHGTVYPGTVVVDGTFDGGPIEVTLPGQQIDFHTATGRLSLTGGVLAFSDAKTTGPLGNVGANGTLDLVSGALETDVKGRVSGAGLVDVGVEGLDSNPYVSLHVSGNVLEDTLPIDVNGRAEFAPFVYGTDVYAEHLVALYEVKKRGDDIAVDADATGEGLLAYDLAAPSFTAPDVHVDLFASGALGVTGGFTLTDARYAAAEGPGSELFGANALGGTFVLAADPEGRQDVTAAITVGEHWLSGGFPGSDGVVGVHVTDEAVAFDVDLNDGARDFVTTKGTYGQLDQKVVLDVLAISPTPRQAWRATEPVRLTVTDGGVADAHVVVASQLGRVTVDGTLGTSGPLSSRITLEAFELDTLAELFPDQAEGLAGTLALDLRLAGVANAARIEADLDGEGLWLPGVAQALDARGRVSAHDGLAALALRVGSSGEALAKLDGTIPVNLDLGGSPGLDPGGPVDLAIVLEPGALARIEHLSPDPLGLPDGDVSGVLALTGTLEDPDFALDGVAEVEVEGWTERGRVEVSVDRSGEQMDYFADLREGFAPRGRIDGHSKTRLGEVFRYAIAGEGPEPDYDDYTLFADDLDVKIAALGLPLQSLVALAGNPFRADGDLLGGLRITGGLSSPVIAGGFNVSGGNVGGVELTGALFTVLPGVNGLEVDARLDFPDGNVEVAGHVPLVVDLTAASDTWVAGDNALTVTGTGIPLGVLRAVDEAIGATAGRLAINGTIGGSPFAPEPDLAASITDGMVEERSLGVRYADVNLDLRVTDTLVSLKKFHVTTEPLQDGPVLGIKGLDDVANTLTNARGGIDASGTIKLEDWTPKSGRMTVTFDEALLSARSDRLLRISGPIVLEGAWPGRLHGDLAVDQGFVRMGASAFADASAFAIDPAVTIHREGLRAPTVVEETGPPAPSVLADLDVDIGIDLNRALTVQVELPIVDDYGALGALLTTATVTAKLGSRDLAVTVQDGELALVHDVQILDGNVNILRSVLAIESGSTLTFVGDPENPILNLTASMDVTGGSVHMAIRGYPLDPQVEFSSEEFPEEDVLTILLTGEAPDQLATSGAAQSFATGVALNSVLGGAGSRSIQIDPSGKLTVPVPNPVLPAVKTTLVMDLRPDVNENQTSFNGELQLGRSTLVQGAIGDTHSYVDLFYEYRF